MVSTYGVHRSKSGCIDNDIAREFCTDRHIAMFPQRLNILNADIKTQMPPALVRDFEVHILKDGKWSLHTAEADNYKRLVYIDIGGEIEVCD